MTDQTPPQPVQPLNYYQQEHFATLRRVVRMLILAEIINEFLNAISCAAHPFDGWPSAGLADMALAAFQVGASLAVVVAGTGYLFAAQGRLALIASIIGSCTLLVIFYARQTWLDVANGNSLSLMWYVDVFASYLGSFLVPLIALIVLIRRDTRPLDA
jgi:hypothetical protein